MTKRFEHSFDCHSAWMQRLYQGRGKENQCTEDCPHFIPQKPPLIKKTTEDKKHKDELLIDYENEVFGWIDDYLDDEN